MLQPKKFKYKKVQKNRNRGLAQSGNKLDFGKFGMKAVSRGFVNGRQLESVRVAIVRALQNSGKLWFRIFPDKPITKKPLEVRMGKGKGEVEEYVAPIKPGKIILEIGQCEEEAARKAIRRAGHKLPIKVKFVKRGDDLK